MEYYKDTPPPRIFRFKNQQLKYRPWEEEEFIRLPPFRRSSTLGYHTIFFGLFYACNNFGHKVVNCRANNGNINNFEKHTQKGYPRRPSETQRISYNRFESLSTEVECYKCNNFGHMAKDCRIMVPPREPQKNNNSHRHEPQKRTWIRKNNKYSNEECTLSLQAKQKKRGWYVDNGCSKHMIGDRDRFLSLIKERNGLVSFENDDSAKIIGKGTVIIGNKNTKAENVLLVEDMKHNLLSVRQMCDQGHKVTFDSQKCETRKEGSGKLIATAVKTSSNIYVLSKIGNKKCCLGKEDEIWLLLDTPTTLRGGVNECGAIFPKLPSCTKTHQLAFNIYSLPIVVIYNQLDVSTYQQYIIKKSSPQ
jgi:hypothetical protein